MIAYRYAKGFTFYSSVEKVPAKFEISLKIKKDTATACLDFSCWLICFGMPAHPETKARQRSSSLLKVTLSPF